MIHTLAELIRIARSGSPFYRDLYAALPEGEARLERLPVVDQAHFWSANGISDNRLLTAHLRDAIVFKSGGTTGSPKFSFYTAEEWAAFVTDFGRGIAAGGLEPGDRVANLFYAGELYASFLFIHESLERSPVPVVQLPIGGATPPAAVLKLLAELQATAVAGVPTTLLALADCAERLVPSARPRLGLVLFGGESLYADQRARLERVFPGVRCRSIGYASVDAGLLGYASRDCGPGEHRVFSEATILEILDETDGEPIEDPGRPGRLVVTSLTRALMPVLRYPVGDRGEWVDAPGPGDRKFRILGRSEEGARVGPVTIYYEDVRRLLDTFGPGVAGSRFQLVVDRESSLDTLTVRVAARDPAPGDSLAEAFHRERPMYLELARAGKIGALRVDWIAPEALATNARTGKLVHVLDRRGK